MSQPTIYYVVKVKEDDKELTIGRSADYEEAGFYMNEARSFGKVVWVNLEDEQGNPIRLKQQKIVDYIGAQVEDPWSDRP
jgi:hypothetical protein